MDDWEKYEQLADTPKYRDDFEFAMYGATHFGMKAIPILATAPTYGDKYPELIKQACETSMSRGDSFGQTTSINKEFHELSGLGRDSPFVYSSKKDVNKVPVVSSSFLLKDMASFCDQRITEIKAERLHEKITSKLAVKQSPPTRGIKI